MRRLPIALVLAGLVASSGSASATDASWVVGTYGDEKGRLGCSADGEYLEFTVDGRVVLHEHADDAGQPVGIYDAPGPSTVTVLLTEPAGHAIQLNTEGTRLAIVAYTIDGVMNPEELEIWISRHGAFVPCSELDG